MVTKPRNGGGGQRDSDRLLFLIFKESINFFSSCEKVATLSQDVGRSTAMPHKDVVALEICVEYIIKQKFLLKSEQQRHSFTYINKIQSKIL